MNGRSQNATAINAADGAVAGTLELGGPEFAVAAGKGSIYVNLKDQSNSSVRCAKVESPLKFGRRWPPARSLRAWLWI